MQSLMAAIGLWLGWGRRIALYSYTNSCSGGFGAFPSYLETNSLPVPFTHQPRFGMRLFQAYTGYALWLGTGRWERFSFWPTQPGLPAALIG